ncbi:MAG: type II toxin-antitoxin system HipA family toxin [Kineosporiaceae bacterium]
MPPVERVHGVWLGRTFVGALRQRGDHTRFVVDRSYADDPSRPVLGLVFEQDLERVHSSALRVPPWFSNLLPEGLLRRWIADQRGVSDQREMELLAEVGDDLPGAVRILPLPNDFGPDEQAPMPTPSVARTDSTGGDARGRFSLAGVQLKLSMVAAGDRLTLPVGGAVGDWIVKFPDRALAHVPVVEYATMTLASRAGIDVPPIRLVHRDELPDTPSDMWPGTENLAFAIERFDRGAERTRVHIEDFAQVRDLYPEQKYSGSFATLARLVHRGRDDDAFVEFARRLAFCVLVDNSDAHLKNWSLRYADPRRPTLAPAYDLVSVAPFHGFGGETALRFGRTRRADQVRYSSFDRLAEQVGAPGLDLAAEARDTVGAATRAWSEIAGELLAQHPDVRSAIDTMIRSRRRSLALT